MPTGYCGNPAARTRRSSAGQVPLLLRMVDRPRDLLRAHLNPEPPGRPAAFGGGSCCSMVFLVQQDERRSDDGADAAGVEADSPQGLEGGLEQRVGPFGLGAKVGID
jgi:hypothetical protein